MSIPSWWEDTSHRSSTPLPTKPFPCEEGNQSTSFKQESHLEENLSKTLLKKSPIQQHLHSQSLLEMLERSQDQEIEKRLKYIKKMVRCMACSGDRKEDQNKFKMIRRTRLITC